MKIKLLSLLAAIPIFFATNFAFSQTTLVPGDIAVLHVQADGTDTFAFVTFVDIDAGTGIYFTDCGVSSAGQFNTPTCTEGARKYIVPAGGLSAGDIVQYVGGGANFATYTDSIITGSFLLSTSGDQILVFQDATDAAGGSNAASNPTFIFLANTNATQFVGSPSSSRETQLPPTLSDTAVPATAIALGAGPSAGDEFDNSIYNGTYDFSGFATTAEAINAAKIALTDVTNFYGINSADATYNNAFSSIPAALNLMTLSNQEFSDRSFSLSPNPSNGNITIRNAGVALQNVTITDINGRTVGSYEMNGITTDTNLSLNLNTGMYFVQLTSDNASTTKKLIIK